MKIVIIGAPLSGKSSLAEKLAQEENLAVYHTDSIIFKLKKNDSLSKDTFENEIKKITVLDNWIIEGRHISKTAIANAEKIIWLKTPFFKCLTRKIKQNGINIELLEWINDQLTNQYFGYLDTNKITDPTYSHNKKYKILLNPYKDIMDK